MKECHEGAVNMMTSFDSSLDILWYIKGSHDPNWMDWLYNDKWVEIPWIYIQYSKSLIRLVSQMNILIKTYGSSFPIWINVDSIISFDCGLFSFG